jgi:hypothetical protein
MRTLVDLLNNDHAYVRIYAEREGYSYKLSTYAPRPIADLFEQMDGYDSAHSAREAARHQLSSVRPGKRRRAKKIGNW